MLTIDEEIAECDRISVELAEIRATFVKQKQEQEKAKTEFKVYAFMARNDYGLFTLALENPGDEASRKLPPSWKGRGIFNRHEIRKIIIGLKRLIGDPVDGN